jgi:hypothetical protein
MHVLQPSSYLSQVATWILINIRPGSYQDGSKRSGSYHRTASARDIVLSGAGGLAAPSVAVPRNS